VPNNSMKYSSATRLLAATYLRLLGRKAFYGINQAMFTAGARGMCVSDPLGQSVGPGEQAFLRRIAKVREPVVFDVGANVGRYSAHLKRVCPSARIWAFEPNRATFQELNRTASEVRFTAVNVGLGETPGSLDLYDYSNTAGRLGSPQASLYREVISGVHRSEVTASKVTITTIDDFVRSERLAHVHLIKVDVEGHELAVLKGAATSINAGMVDIVQFEFNEMNVISRVFFHDFYDALPGYTFFRMVIDGLVPLGEYRARSHEVFFLQNVVATRPRLEYLDQVV
jgi:FkbM family methyltransferase